MSKPESYYYTERDTPSYDVQIFRSYERFQEYVNKRPDTDAPGMKESMRKADPHWHSGISWDDNAQALAQGWGEGSKQVRELTAEISRFVGSMARKPEPEPRIAGGRINRAAYRAGRARVFQQLKETGAIRPAAGGKVIRIECLATAPGSLDAAVMTNRGAHIAALVMALETFTAYSCEVWVSTWNDYSGRKRHGQLAPVKKAGEALDLDRLAFALASPTMLRRCMWAVREQHPDGRALCDDGGYGYCVDSPEPQDLDIPNAVQWNRLKADKRKQWLLDGLTKFGIKLNG